MRRFLCFILCVSVLFCMCACNTTTSAENTLDNSAENTLDNSAEDTKETRPDGSYYYTDNIGSTVWTVKSLPFTMDFDGKEANLSDVDFFEVYADHGYTAWIVVSIDRSNLTDDDIYWITTPDNTLHKDLSVNVSNVKYDGSDFDITMLNKVGSVYNDTHIYYAFCTELNRYSYIGEAFTCNVRFFPESAVDPEGISYYYDFEINEENYSDSENALSEDATRALYQIIS